ncbi:MAG: UTRA domain-containing protein, partial [Ktedonobacteraceae bacterium]|nr:UTRA domain-containing protein [Ktedonobacteraceae bacterium]
QTVREQLRLTDEEQVARLERVRTADGVPVSLEVDYLPYPRAASVYRRAKETAEGSLYSLMAAEGLQPYIAEQTITVDHATAREVDLLHIAPQEAGMRLFCTTFDETGAPIEYTEAFLPANRYDFRLTLRVGR